MAQLDHSLDAINVLNKFYRCSVLVYVEGDDDIPFWSAVFTELSGEDVAVEGLGGSEEVEKYLARVVDDDAKIVIARDADYSLVTGNRVTHDRVLYSFGYSIENSMYLTKAIVKIAAICNRKVAAPEAEVSKWLDTLTSECRALVVCDITSSLEGLGVAALGSNCDRFMRSEKSPEFDKEKISARIQDILPRVTANLRAKTEAILGNVGGYGMHFIRGHFLASAVLRYVAKHAGRSVSNETLYACGIGQFEKDIGRSHPHKEYYAAAVSRAVASCQAL